MPPTHDVIVIGAGPPGENVADYATQRGLAVVIVEAELVGGECSYWACMPSKALLRPPAALAAARRVPGAAPAVTGTVDVDQVLRSRDAYVQDWEDDGQVAWLRHVGVELVRGRGRLAGPRVVEVTAEDGTVRRLEAGVGVVLATGSRPTMPPIEGLEAAAAWDNRDVTSIEQVPERLVVLGGGYVGAEMGQALQRLGAEVTIIQRNDRLLAEEEPYASQQVLDALRDDGITVLLGASTQRVARGPDGTVTATLEDGQQLTGDELLVAVGRSGRTDDLGLDTIDLAPDDDGFVVVDDHCRVPGHDWLYAVGDVNGRALLTHQGKYQARLVGDRLAGIDTDPAWADERALVRVAFTDPQVAAVGLTADAAHDAGMATRVVDHDLGATAGGSLRGEDIPGTARLVIDRDREVVVGATFVGPDAGELLHAATIAVAGEVPLARLWHAVPAFPTTSEVWLRLLEAVREEQLADG